jgi:3'-5' exonuclease
VSDPRRRLISSFVDRIAKLSPRLVTFGGSSFDLPVLRYRAMVNHVAAPGLALRPYLNRYTEDAIDLCDVLSSFSFQGTRAMPCKPDGMTGADVEKYYLDGSHS